MHIGLVVAVRGAVFLGEFERLGRVLANREGGGHINGLAGHGLRTGQRTVVTGEDQPRRCGAPGAAQRVEVSYSAHEHNGRRFGPKDAGGPFHKLDVFGQRDFDPRWRLGLRILLAPGVGPGATKTLGADGR